MNYAPKLTGMAKQALAMHPDGPVSLVLVHDGSGKVAKVCSLFEARALPATVQPHCRTAFFVKKGAAVILHVEGA